MSPLNTNIQNCFIVHLNKSNIYEPLFYTVKIHIECNGFCETEAFYYFTSFFFFGFYDI